jgi:hypothetical protein
MKWNNLAATDVITATKIATDHGGWGGMYKSLRIGRICVEANEEEIQEGKEE